MKRLKDSCQCQRYLRIGETGNGQFIRFAITYKPDYGVSLNMEKAGRYSSEKPSWVWKEGVEVSHDLAALVGLFIASLVPAGVLADKLQEERPDLEWAADFLRQWDALEGTQ